MPKLVISLRLSVYGYQFTDHGSKDTVNGQLTTHNRKSAGFTLIEFLVVLGLLSLTVGATLLFLTSVLKGSNQANVVSETKQNGQFVLDSLERQIRNATGAANGANTKHLVLNRLNALPLQIKCFDEVSGTSNGYIGTVEDSNTGVPGVSDGSYSPITNIDPISGVSIQDCSMMVQPESSGGVSPPIVTISFKVQQGVKAPSRQDFMANLDFQTRISLRSTK